METTISSPPNQLKIVMKSTLFEEDYSGITLEENKESFDTFLSPTSINLKSAKQSSNQSYHQHLYFKPPPSVNSNLCSSFYRQDYRPDPKTINSPIPVTPTLSDQNLIDLPYIVKDNTKHIHGLQRNDLPVKESIKSL